jgi:hypothetical protein
MAETPSTCPDCLATYEAFDNYCRSCGMYLAALRDTAIVAAQTTLPVPAERPRSSLPAPIKKAATAMAVGTALQIGVSLTGKYLARQAGKQAVNAVRPRPAKRAPRENQTVVPQPAQQVDPHPFAAAVSETVVIRRVWIRRSQ